MYQDTLYMMMSKMNLKIPRKTLDALQKLAEKRGETIEETLRHAVNTEVYMYEQLKKGSTILCQDSEGETWKIVFTHMR